MRIPFIKAQGAGNDFIIIDKYVEKIEKSKSLIKSLCSRKQGIGCDQLILIKKETSFYEIVYFNSDGSKAQNCGNGLRCVYKYLVENKKKKNPIIKTKNFTHQGRKIKKLYEINVGNVSVDWNLIPLTKNINTQDIKFKNIKIPGLIRIMSATIGNPHCIVLVKKLNNIKIADLGPKLQRHVLFKNQANITFVEKNSDSKITVEFWERGVGHTLACGSGTCATAYVLYKNRYTKNKLEIKTETSKLYTSIKNKSVLLAGPAELVFQGVIKINE